jgi:hypothetical protein
MEDRKWLLLCSQLPATPSRTRVMLWRRMRAAGATGLQNGVWVLPHTAEYERFMSDMQSYVEQQGGTGQVFVARVLNPGTEAHILARFRADRDGEYGEFKEQCEDFLAEIAKEIQRRNFSYAEFEENEQNLNKLVDWLAKIKRRDFTGPSHTADPSRAANAEAPNAGAVEADAMLDACRQALLEFADQVYRNEAVEGGKDITDDRGMLLSKWAEDGSDGLQA